MSDDDHAWPSLILAKHDTAHREHIHQHQHQHHLFHRAQTGATTTVVQSVVTEITATVSVIQQIDVDSNGSTFSIQTVLASGAAATSDTSAYTTTSVSPGVTSPSSASSTTAGGSPQISSASQSLNSSTSTSSASTLSTSTGFSSLIASSNSTTLISSSSSSLAATPNFSNSSISSTSTLSSSSSFAYLTSSSSSVESTSSTSSISSLYSPSSSSSTVATGAGGGVAGGTAGSTGGTSTSTAASGSGNGSSSSNTPTPVVVGGVVGGVAGAAILIFLLLAFIRWKKRHQSMLSLGSGNEGPGAVTSREGPPPSAPSGGMTERRSLAFVPAALANLSGFNKRTSRQTDRTVSSTAESERGFYRVSGRKLPSVLQTGGDGYGGGIVEGNTLSGSSFYRDSQGFYGGPGSPSTAGPAGASTRPESGVPVMRPSPARTPVTQEGPFSAVVTAPEPLTPPRRPDVLGRSHPSLDGSHTSSRFTEDV